MPNKTTAADKPTPSDAAQRNLERIEAAGRKHSGRSVEERAAFSGGGSGGGSVESPARALQGAIAKLWTDGAFDSAAASRPPDKADMVTAIRVQIAQLRQSDP